MRWRAAADELLGDKEDVRLFKGTFDRLWH
jgi:hypothetical protein